MIRVITTSPMEAEVYALNSKINNAIDTVANMITDLTTDNPDTELQILLVVNDPDQQEEFGLAFSGSNLSLEFTKDAIDLVEFDLGTGDETVLETFEADETAKAATCLFNRLNA